MGVELANLIPSEKELCNSFHNNYYGKRRTFEQWCWQFDSRLYTFPAHPFIVAKDRNHLVGTQAMMPIPMIDEDGIFWAGKSEETLILPDYRGHKLLGKMYSMLFEMAEREKFAYVWGFTPATKALLRVGYEIPASTQQLFFPFSNRFSSTTSEGTVGNLSRPLMMAARLASYARLKWYESLHARRHSPAGIRIETAKEPPRQAELLCQNFIKQWGGTTILRNREYLGWRVFNNPYVRDTMRVAYINDHLVGWAVSALGRDGMGYIVDLLVSTEGTPAVNPSHVTGLLLSDTVRRARQMGATGIRGWTVNDHPFDLLVRATARRMGFFHVHKGYAVVLYYLDASRDRRARHAPRHWYITRIFAQGGSG